MYTTLTLLLLLLNWTNKNFFFLINTLLRDGKRGSDWFWYILLSRSIDLWKVSYTYKLLLLLLLLLLERYGCIT
jgi:hypothetical protein